MAKSGSPVAFGPYIITRRIARGGMAEIFRAQTCELSGREPRWVAVKMMRSALGHDALREQLFAREARISLCLEHPNIVPVIHAGREQGRPFITMEYVRGQDLSRFFEREDPTEPLPFELVLYVGMEAARGLGYAHNATGETGAPLGIVHRDVSPGNVMVGYDGRVQVLDFGVARLNEDQGVRTQTGTLRGKFAYMSPEQTLGEDLDARSDVFSLGTVLYELLTGSNCFRGDNPIATLERVQRLRPVPPSRINREVPKEVDRILGRCLAKDRKKRFADAHGVHDAIEDFFSVRPFEGAELAKRFMRQHFSWEQEEEERELFREKEEVALFAVIDFQDMDETKLDAARVVVSTDEEASEADIRSMARTYGESSSDDEVFDVTDDLIDDVTVHEPSLLPDAGSEEQARNETPVPKHGSTVEPDSSPAEPQRPPPPVPLSSGSHLGPGDARLRGFAVDEPVAPMPDEAVQADRPRRDRKKPLWVAAVVVLLSLLLVAGLWVARPGPEDQPKGHAEGQDLEGPARVIDPIVIGSEEGTAPAPKAKRDTSRHTRKQGSTARKKTSRRVKAPRAAQTEGAGRTPAAALPTRPIGPEPPRKALKRSRRRPRRRKKPPVITKDHGFLTLSAKPWATIVIDGKKWPNRTPQSAIPLKAGHHTVTLSNGETRARKTLMVHIVAGEEKTVAVDLRRRR